MTDQLKQILLSTRSLFTVLWINILMKVHIFSVLDPNSSLTVENFIPFIMDVANTFLWPAPGRMIPLQSYLGWIFWYNNYFLACFETGSWFVNLKTYRRQVRTSSGSSGKISLFVFYSLILVREKSFWFLELGVVYSDTIRFIGQNLWQKIFGPREIKIPNHCNFF